MGHIGSTTARPVQIVTQADLVENGGSFKLAGNVAIRAYGDDSKKAIGHVLSPIYIVSDDELYENGGSFKVKQNEPVQVVQLATSSNVAGNIAIPVYMTNNWPVVEPQPPLANLVLWLKSDTGTFQQSDGTIPAVNNNDVIGYWADQSGNNNNVIQATTSRKPVLATSALNGYNGISFDSSDDGLLTVDNVAELSDVFIVVANDSVGFPPNTEYLFSQGADLANNAFYVATSTSLVYAFLGSLPALATSATPLGTSFLILSVSALKNTSGGLVLRNNGVQIASANTGSPNWGRKFALGYLELSVSFAWGGDIIEVLGYTGTLSSSDINLVGNYLSSRYGLSWSDL